MARRFLEEKFTCSFASSGNLLGDLFSNHGTKLGFVCLPTLVAVGTTFECFDPLRDFEFGQFPSQAEIQPVPLGLVPAGRRAR